jgi:hypothetical protein
VYFQNSTHGDAEGNPQLPIDRAILDEVHRHLPDALTMRGSLNDEEPEKLFRARRQAMSARSTARAGRSGP